MKSLFSNKVHTIVCTKKNYILLSTVYLGVFAGHKIKKLLIIKNIKNRENV